MLFPLHPAMAFVPQRQSVMVQLTSHLQQQIAEGAWGEWLPTERRLAESLQVSRNTLRNALRQLQRAGVLRPVHGLGNRIVNKPAVTRDPKRDRTVILLAPESLEHMRPAQTLMIDELRALLVEHTCRLQVLHGKQYFRVRAASALQKLIRQHPAGCWILLRASPTTQAWFFKQGLPVVIAGSPDSEFALPYVDVDHRALCRHASGVLLAQGHRRIALVAEKTNRAGDLASELGFMEGVRMSPHTDTEPLVVWHQPSVESMCAVVRRLMQNVPPPTALLVANPLFYLTVTSRLAQLGFRIPEDVSVLSRDDDPFLTFLVPQPARYAIPSHVFAKRLLAPVLEAVDTGAIRTRAITITPELIAGSSIGRPNTQGQKASQG